MTKSALAVAMVALAGPALAHTGQGDVAGFLDGVLHPVLGLDHLLAMLAVGLWSAFVLPDRAYAGAATFLVAMAAGAGLAWVGVAMPGVELLILASVVVFGLLVLLARPGQGAVATRLSLAAIPVFAACHGHAHATEASGPVAAYLAGFLIATANLHLVGISVARAAARRGAADAVQRAFGAGIAGAGMLLIVG